MPKELVISAAPHETRVAILEDGQLCEIYIEREKEFALVGSIYKGRVTRVLPGMQSAFVDIGLDSDAFLYVGDFLENLEDYDHVVTPAENKIEKIEQQGGNAFAQQPAAEDVPLAAQGDAQPFQQDGESSQQSSPAFAPDGEPGQPPASYVPDPALASPRYTPPPSASQGAPRQDRGPGNFSGPRRGNDRGGNDRGNDRGRRRGGRFRGRGGRDNNEHRPNRGDLPPSKYAPSSSPASSSSRPFAPRAPYEPPAEDLPPDFQPIILPGESLAKYKDRIPGATAPQVSPSPESAPAAESLQPGLPTSLYAPPLESPAAAEREPEAHPDPRRERDFAGASEPEPIPADEIPGALMASPVDLAPADLSDDEVAALAEQLAEARHEEVSAVAESNVGTRALDQEDPPAPETAAETDEFITEAEQEESSEETTDEDREHEQGREEHEDAADRAHEDAHEESAQEESLAVAGEAAAPESDADFQSEQNPDDQIGNVAPPSPGQRPPMSARISQPNNRPRFQRPMRRGGRPQRGRDNRPPSSRPHDSRHQAQKPRPQLISEMLKAGQEILVQIAKEPLGKKGARITSHVALPGRFLVYMPTVNHVGVSRRIGSAEERSRLRRLVTESKGTFPGGFIVRTAAEGAPDDEIRADVEFLGRTWEKTIAQAEPRKAPSLLHRDLNLVERILRDYVSNDYTAIWINSQEEFSKVVEFVNRFQPKLVDRVKLYTKSTPIFEEFGIQQELDKALRPKVWLKSGGYIVINHTEALVAIDVNTGKYVGRGSTRLEDTIVKTNLEAVKEIVRQIRLRDLGGIIILDFIDMEERRNREKVMAALDSALRSDRAPSKALPFNEFGLVAVTRKRTKQALERVLCQPCPYCTGSGMVKSVPTICYEIQAEARKMSPDLDASSLTLRVHPEIAKTLKTREAGLIEELEQITRKSVIIQADPTLHWEQYDIY